MARVPISVSPAPPVDMTSYLPSEMKTTVLGWVSRPDLLGSGLVSRDWRKAARADTRFYMLVKLKTYPTTKEVASAMIAFEEVAEYAVKHEFWIKFVFDYVCPTDMDDMVYCASALPIAERFGVWLVRGMVRTVAIQIYGPATAWEMIEPALNSAQAPVLRTLELSGLYRQPNIARKRDGVKPAKLTPHLFKGHAPFLCSLALKEIPLQSTIVPAFNRVRDLSLIVAVLQGTVGLGKVAAVALAPLFPSIRNLEIRLDSIPATKTPTSHLLLNLRELKLDSLVTVRSYDMVHPADNYITFPCVQGYITPSEWCISGNSVCCQLEMTFAPILNRTHTYSLDMLQSNTHEEHEEPVFDYYFALRNEVARSQRVYGYSRRTRGLAPDPDADARIALSLCAVQLVTLTIDVGYIPALVEPMYTEYPQLRSLEIQLLGNWEAWPASAIPDDMAFIPTSREDFNPNTHLVHAPRLVKVILRSVGVPRRVSPNIIDGLACHLQLPNARLARLPTLELHSTLVSRLPARFDPFIGFDHVVAYHGGALPYDKAFGQYGVIDGQMGDDWKSYSATKIYS